MDYQLDLRAYLCPLPLLMAKKALRQLAQGESLTLRLSPKTSLTDFQQLSETLGLVCELHQQNREEIQLIISDKRSEK